MVDKTRPFVGFMYLELALEGSPTQYERICEATGMSGIGKTNDQVDASTFCSNGFRDFIAGMAEGSEVGIDANYIVSSTVRRLLMTAVDDKATVGLRLVVDPDGDNTPEEEYVFTAAAIGYVLNPSIDDKNAIAFTLKINSNLIYVDRYVAP